MLVDEEGTGGHCEQQQVKEDSAEQVARWRSLGNGLGGQRGVVHALKVPGSPLVPAVFSRECTPDASRRVSGEVRGSRPRIPWSCWSPSSRLSAKTAVRGRAL